MKKYALLLACLAWAYGPSAFGQASGGGAGGGGASGAGGGAGASGATGGAVGAGTGTGTGTQTGTGVRGTRSTPRSALQTQPGAGRAGTGTGTSGQNITGTGTSGAAVPGTGAIGGTTPGTGAVGGTTPGTGSVGGVGTTPGAGTVGGVGAIPGTGTGSVGGIGTAPGSGAIGGSDTVPGTGAIGGTGPGSGGIGGTIPGTGPNPLENGVSATTGVQPGSGVIQNGTVPNTGVGVTPQAGVGAGATGARTPAADLALTQRIRAQLLTGGTGTATPLPGTVRSGEAGMFTPQNMSGVQMNANNGTVTLRGSVNSEAERRLLETRIRGMNGVQSVVNNLTVGPRATSGSAVTPATGTTPNPVTPGGTTGATQPNR